MIANFNTAYPPLERTIGYPEPAVDARICSTQARQEGYEIPEVALRERLGDIFGHGGERGLPRADVGFGDFLLLAFGQEEDNLGVGLALDPSDDNVVVLERERLLAVPFGDHFVGEEDRLE